MALFASIKQWWATLLAPADDPRATVTDTLQRHHQLTDKVHRAMEKVAASKRELEGRLQEVRARVATPTDGESPDPFAEQLRELVLQEVDALEVDIKELEEEERELLAVEQRLSLQRQAFTARQQTLAAHHSAAEAWDRIQRDLDDVGEELADLGVAVEKAEQASDVIRARTAIAGNLAGQRPLPGAVSFASAGSRSLARRYSIESAMEQSPPLKQLLVRGLKTLMELELEYSRLKETLVQRRDTDLLATAYVSGLAEETYRQGVDVLQDGLSLLQVIRTPGPAQIEQRIRGLEQEMGGLEDGPVHASRGLKEEALKSARDRLELVGQQQQRVEELLQQCDRCVAALNRTRIEIAALKAEGAETSVQAATESLINATNEAKAVQAELRSLGL